MREVESVQTAFFMWLLAQDTRLDNIGQVARFVSEQRTVTFADLAYRLDDIAEANPGYRQLVAHLIEDFDQALKEFNSTYSGD